MRANSELQQEGDGWGMRGGAAWANRIVVPAGGVADLADPLADLVAEELEQRVWGFCRGVAPSASGGAAAGAVGGLERCQP